jgi:hypothetical protein
MDRLTWSRLTHLQVGKYAEYFVKMEFTLYGFDVYQAEVDDKGIDFVIRKGQQTYYDIQVKSVRGFNYIFFRKECFELRENLYAAIVILEDGEMPKLFLIPATAWCNPNSIFVNRTYEPPAKSKPEWGLNLSAKNQQLLNEYSFEKIIAKL